VGNQKLRLSRRSNLNLFFLTTVEKAFFNKGHLTTAVEKTIFQKRSTDFLTRENGALPEKAVEGRWFHKEKMTRMIGRFYFDNR